jgi:hypothetical protein
LEEFATEQCGMPKQFREVTQWQLKLHIDGVSFCFYPTKGTLMIEVIHCELILGYQQQRQRQQQ